MLHVRASAVAMRAELLSAVSVSHIREPNQLLPTLPLVQLPASRPEEAAQGIPRTWPWPPTWETRIHGFWLLIGQDLPLVAIWE